ncbi:MAG TPA: NAD(P)-binding protein, partial [Rhizomicrobium sp.]|nr:NAD(P)-binding protein [Rhizomicrobium sp.]
MDRRRRRLGMDVPIDRRDFLNGAAMSAAAVSAMMLADPTIAAPQPGPQDKPGYYPPTLNGIRGSQPGSFDVAHSVRDGTFWSTAEKMHDTDGVYDLVVVGAGISGLSAAFFYRAAKPNAKILILDNHDDFGGHARRNEYHLNGRLELLNGGTELIDSPRPYSAVASGLLKTLGIEPAKLAKACDRPEVYDGLGPASFFDKETFGVDRLVVGGSTREGETVDWNAFISKTPLSPKAKADMLRIEAGMEDYFPGLTSDQKKDKLSRMSYFDYLSKVVKADPKTVAFYQQITHDEWGVGIDAEPALDCWGFGLPGFSGLKLDPRSIKRMGNTAAGYNENSFETF